MDFKVHSPGKSDPATSFLDPNDINIVLMGETGVGKSTFINAFVNYLKFSTLKQATASTNIHCLIASKFIVMDENYKEKVVTFGTDENECHEAGASLTQSPRSYRFFMGDRYVRLIDTPGIGDTRGIEKDEENIDRLLETLGELKNVNAFCILLKPNNLKLTIFFQYCIKQLLLRLNKSASENMVFVFTNSRSTFYRPGDSQVPIKKMLESIKASSNIDIPFGKENVFCMDNEAFRFLLAKREGNVKFTKSEEKDFAASWEKSVDLSFKMLSYVAGLKPHRMQETVSINEARRVILNLYNPLAQMIKNIKDNLDLIVKKQEELDDKNKTIDELRKSLYFKTVKMRVIPFDHPKLVCEHVDCTEFLEIEGIKHAHDYKICEDTFLGHILANTYYLFTMFSGSCRTCGHKISCHRAATYNSRAYLDEKRNERVDANILTESEARIRIDYLIRDLKERSKLLEKEKETVQESMAKFAHFLKRNAITPYNDTYQEYIKCLIDNENNRGSNKNEDLIRSYKNLSDNHKEKMRILDEQLEKAKEKGAEIISAEDVFKLVKELYDLKSTGEFMQECYEKQQLVRQRAALLYTEKNVDGRRESVPKNMVFNLIIIVMVIIIAIMIYYCIAWYKHLG